MNQRDKLCRCRLLKCSGFLKFPITIKEEGTVVQKLKENPAAIKEHNGGGGIVFLSSPLRTGLYGLISGEQLSQLPCILSFVNCTAKNIAIPFWSYFPQHPKPVSVTAISHTGECSMCAVLFCAINMLLHWYIQTCPLKNLGFRI